MCLHEPGLRTRPVRTGRSPLSVAILAALAVFWAVSPVAGADIQMTQVPPNLLEITGGSGRQTWHLRYGTGPSLSGVKPQLLAVAGDRAYFSHGDWLRLIDAKHGVVIGRWHFPGEIAGLAALGKQVQVQLYLGGWWAIVGGPRAGWTLTFDPDAPAIPNWPSVNWGMYGKPITEAAVPFKIAVAATFSSTAEKIPAERARQMIPAMEEAVQRDPLSPWFRIVLGKALLDIGDPRAGAVFQEAVRVPSTDFTELLRISTFLDDLGQADAARLAFERGYRDFLERGNDPRLLLNLWGRRNFYSVPWRVDPSTELGRQFLERTYRLQPYGSFAELAWQLYANWLEKSGRGEEARTWRARVDEARVNSYGMQAISQILLLDHAILVFFAMIFAVPLYLLILWARYRPQRRLELTGERRLTGEPVRFSLFFFSHWERRERIAFFAVVLGALFLAYGLTLVEPGTLPMAQRSAHPHLVSGAFRVLLAAVFGALPVAVLYGLLLFRRHAPRRLGLGRYFGWTNLQYWDWRERIAFLTIILAGWFAAGVAGGFLQRIGRHAESPYSFWMGSFAGPVTSRYLEGRLPVDLPLPATPERNLLLAMAYQHNGENEKAERLYRQLPNFAESGITWGSFCATPGGSKRRGRPSSKPCSSIPDWRKPR